jgi:hypothetical protein
MLDRSERNTYHHVLCSTLDVRMKGGGAIVTI